MNISANSKTEFKNILGCEFGDYSIWGRCVEKTRGKKSRATVPLRRTNVAYSCPWGALCEELIVESPSASMADNFHAFSW
jgi:hypothetical protein